MINPTMKTFAKKMKGFNTILLLQLRVLLEKYGKLNCTMNLALACTITYIQEGDEKALYLL